LSNFFIHVLPYSFYLRRVLDRRALLEVLKMILLSLISAKYFASNACDMPRELALDLSHLHFEVMLKHFQVLWAILSFPLHILEANQEGVVIHDLVHFLIEALSLLIDAFC
jgi:hypothetical protein